MTKEQIINDINFKQKCDLYGLDCEKCEIYDDVILLNTPALGLYVLFDFNYNTVGVEFIDYSKFNNKEDLARNKYYEYCNFTGDDKYGSTFGFPFENYTLKHIIDLSNRIEIMENNQVQSLITRINGETYERENSKDIEYSQMVSYIKFLGEEIKQYFLMNYHMQSLGLEVPNVYDYVKLLISRVDSCIDYQILYNRKPIPSYILSWIGQNYKESKMDYVLYDIADLLMKERGFKSTNALSDEIEKINELVEKKDLSMVANDLLKILGVIDEEIQIKEDINKEIADNLVEEKAFVLSKKKNSTSNNNN